jgi:hypothetical protein
LACPACHGDGGRPPRHHLRVPSAELEDEAVAVAFRMAWLEAGVESPASKDQARGVLAASKRREAEVRNAWKK